MYFSKNLLIKLKLLKFTPISYNIKILKSN